MGRARLLRILGSGFSTQPLMNSKLLLRLILVSGSLERCTERVVDLRIRGQQALCGSQWRNRFLVFLEIHKTESPPQICLPKIWVEFDRLGIVGDRLIPLLITPIKFSQNVDRPSVVGIDLNLFQQFLFRTFQGVWPGIRPREKEPSEQKVDTGSTRFLLNHPFIFELGGLPLSLCFESLGIQLMSGEGLRSGPAKILRSACRQI